MDSPREIRCDIAIVGAGPAGIAGAVTAAQAGAGVVLLDDNPSAGGQIWRGGKHATTDAAQWLDSLAQSPVKLICGARVFEAEENILFAETAGGVVSVIFEKLILATGARERFIPFPGWTLPNVLGVGALQALCKSGLSVERKRIVIAGTGPLLFAAAECALEHGADVVAIAEQSSWAQYAKFAAGMLSESSKRRDALRLAFRLTRVPHWKNSWPLAAVGEQRVEAVRLHRARKTIEIPCDYLACGYHLVPNTELPSALGCKLNSGFVAVNEDLQTSIAGVYCVGEPTGIAGVEAALLDGQIAGLAATIPSKISPALRKAHAASRLVVKILSEATRLGDQLKALAADDTIVCRCEDVPLAQLRTQASGASAKLQTRCGMGPCQGRVCGPIVDFLFGWTLNRQRPPLFPAQCASLAAIGYRNSTDSSMEVKQ